MNDCGGTGLYSILSSTDGLRRRTNYNDNYRESVDIKVPKLFSDDFDDDIPSIIMPPKSSFSEDRSRAYSTWATREDMWAAKSESKKTDIDKPKHNTETAPSTRIKVNRLTQNKSTDTKNIDVKKRRDADTPVVPDNLFTDTKTNRIYPFSKPASTSSETPMEYPIIQPRMIETNAKEVVISFPNTELAIPEDVPTTEPKYFVPDTLPVIEPVVNIPIIRLPENDPENTVKPCLVSLAEENSHNDFPEETLVGTKYIKKIDFEKYKPKSNTYISDKSQNQHKMANKGEKFNIQDSQDTSFTSERREPLFSVAGSSSTEQLEEPIVWPALIINDITTSFKVVGDLQKGSKLRIADQKFLEVESSYFPKLTRGKFQSRKTIISFLNHMFSETKRTSYELLENIRNGVDTDTNVTSLSTFIYKMSIFLHRFETMRSAYEADSNTYSQLGNIRDDFFSFYHNFYRDMTISK